MWNGKTYNWPKGIKLFVLQAHGKKKVDNFKFAGNLIYQDVQNTLAYVGKYECL
jgi:hypothetical protein